MASERKKEKRKIRKQKKRQEYLKKMEEELKNKSLDILNILKTESYDTKPKMAKFLEQYVKYIRIYNANNIEVYPSFKYTIHRVFITFLNNDDITMIKREKMDEIFLTHDFKDIILKPKEKELISQFLQFLFDFKFIQ